MTVSLPSDGLLLVLLRLRNAWQTALFKYVSSKLSYSKQHSVDATVQLNKTEFHTSSCACICASLGPHTYTHAYTILNHASCPPAFLINRSHSRTCKGCSVSPEEAVCFSHRVPLGACLKRWWRFIRLPFLYLVYSGFPLTLLGLYTDIIPQTEPALITSRDST